MIRKIHTPVKWCINGVGKAFFQQMQFCSWKENCFDPVFVYFKQLSVWSIRRVCGKWSRMLSLPVVGVTVIVG